MESLRGRCYAVLVVFVFCMVLCCNGDDEEALSAPMAETEQAALYSAIQGFVGKWWNGSDLYPDPCGWTPIQGVSCDLYDGLWYVTALTIGPVHDNSLACAPKSEFTPHLFALTHLKSLSFFNCFLSPHHHSIQIPTDDWYTLSGSLESLEFRTNPGLTGQIPVTLGDLRSLQSLVLLENGLAGELPANMGNLVSLRRLVLAGNKFSGRIPATYGGLNKLLILDLSRNSLHGPLPLTFGGFTSLLKLDLSKNRLDGKIPKTIGKLKNLTLLDLSNNKFSGGLSPSIQEMGSLQELVLSENPIGGPLTALDWAKLMGLTILDLSNMGLTGDIPDAIFELKRLRFLGLNDNNLSGSLSPKLESLPNVGAIYLNGNNLTGELKFSQGFFGKMGRRFGVWNNPNLCYPVSLNGAPFGVRPCLDGNILSGETKFLKNQNPHLVVSGGFSRCGFDGFFWVFFVIFTLFNLNLFGF